MTYRDIFEEVSNNTSINNKKEQMKKQLELGLSIEKEHEPTYLYLKDYIKEHKELPSAKDFYEHIVADHINENKTYYTYLKEMEKKFKKS